MKARVRNMGGCRGLQAGFSQASSGSPTHLPSLDASEGRTSGKRRGGGKVPADQEGEQSKQSCPQLCSLSWQKLPGVAGPTRRKVMGRKADPRPGQW